MLRFEEGTWTAYDTAFLAHGKNHSREAVFRCDGTDITQPGWNIWYSEDLWPETKVL